MGIRWHSASETIALAIHLENADVVGQPVEKRAGEAFGAECLGPFVKRQIAGDQGRSALVALRDQFEQQLGAGLRQRHEAEFIDDEQLVSCHLLLEAQQAALVAGLHHLADQGRGGGEADGQALLAGGQTKAERDVRLARATGAESNNVLAPLDPFAPGQFQHLHLVELRDGREVEAVQAFDGREPGGLDAPLDHPPFPVDQFQFDEPGEISDMVHAFRRTLPGQLLMLAQECRQLESLEVMGKQDFRGVAHATPSALTDSSRM